MSIRDLLKARIRVLWREKKLFRLRPSYGASRRCVFVSREIAELLNKDPQQFEDDRVFEIRGHLEGFVVGESFRITDRPFGKNPTSEIAPTHPMTDRMWDFRVTDLDEGSRCFGGFAGKDVFIAVTYELRNKIGEHFSESQKEARQAWDDLFAPLDPFEGETLDDYLSQPFEAV